MPKTLEAITLEVLELPHNQRLALARIILDLDAGPTDPDVEALWDEEIRARLVAVREGRVKTDSISTFNRTPPDRPLHFFLHNSAFLLHNFAP